MHHYLYLTEPRGTWDSASSPAATCLISSRGGEKPRIYNLFLPTLYSPPQTACLITPLPYVIIHLTHKRISFEWWQALHASIQCTEGFSP